MPDTMTLVAAGVIAWLAFLAGYIACALVAANRERLDAQQLAERADGNGRRLLAIARELRAIVSPRHSPGDPPTLNRALAFGWAHDLEDAAAAHLECINAITLDARATCSPQRATYLGEFEPRATEAATLRELAARAVPFLRDEGGRCGDDGANEPLELAREIEAAVAAQAVRS